MNSSTYLFYDIETTGLNICFDQVLQFAAIRTDMDLNEIERYEINVRLNSDLLPAPGAIKTHNISLDEMQNGENEVEAMQKIHALLNTPGTISVGYNTLSFDDQFLRFSFYRNLLTPYTHQYANGCARMDIFPITILFYLYKREAIEWPEIDGKISLRLENLIRLNNLAEGHAHNAMVDTVATLALARKLRQHQEMWDYVTGYFNKQEDLARMSQLRQNQALLLHSKLGAKNFFQAPVLYLGQHEIYKNQSLWLRLDNEKLKKTTAETIAENVYVITKRTAEEKIVLPPKDRFMKHLSPERLALAEENLNWLRENPNLQQLIADYYLNFTYPEIENIDPSAALYTVGFPTPQEQKLFSDFHRAAIQDKERVFSRFNHPVYRELALRILGRNYYAHISEDLQKEFDTYRKKALNHELIDFKGGKKLSKTKASEELGELLNDEALNAQQQNNLRSYQEFLAAL